MGTSLEGSDLSSKRKRNIRKLMASTGLNYTRAAKIDRQQQAQRRRGRSLTIDEIIQAISSSNAALMPKTSPAKALANLGPALPDYSKLLGSALPDYSKLAATSQIAELSKAFNSNALAEAAKAIQSTNPMVNGDLAKALGDYSPLTTAAAQVFDEILPKINYASLMPEMDYSVLMPALGKLLRSFPNA